MFQAGKSNQVTFKVNVMGTSSTPTVRVVLGTDPEMSYPASHTVEDKWMAVMMIPEHVEGTYSMRVEVVLNNRLFTPITKSVTIGRAEAAAPTPNETTSPSVPTPPEAVEPAPDTVRKYEPILQRDPIVVPEDAGATASVAADVASNPTKAMPPLRRIIPEPIVIKQPPAPKKTQGLSMLKSFADKPAKKMHERIVTDMPRPGGAKTPITVNIASVDAITGPTKAKITETIKSAKSKPKANASIKLIKEQLFYE